MLHPAIQREIADRYHRDLPDEIRAFLKSRGIPATLIERHLLGWNGERITIPVFGPKRNVLGFRYADVPSVPTDRPTTYSGIGLGPELYGWDTLARARQRVVICDGEFDRLVLEANGFLAVASTGGAAVFLEAWLHHFAPVKHVYICFRRSLVGAAAAKKVQRLLPRARIVTLPAEVGNEGTVSDFFVTLGRTNIDFDVLLAAAEGAAGEAPRSQPILALRPHQKSLRRRAESVKRDVRLHDVLASYLDLQASGTHLAAHCPFHDDTARSFFVYPAADTYRCEVCGAEGDVLRFLMDKESMTFGQALDALERFRYTHELFGTS
jgi:DNA primase